MSTFQFTDVPFEASASIPPEYTCDGEDVSPPLKWTDPPDETESLTLIVDDPDAPGAGVFTHWVLFNLPGFVTELPRAYSAGDPRIPTDQLAPREGINDFGDVGYGGPCPPTGEQHRYVFSLFALDTDLEVDAGADPEEVREALEGHVINTAEHMGLYRRA